LWQVNDFVMMIDEAAKIGSRLTGLIEQVKL
jgi:hypothetical protein